MNIVPVYYGLAVFIMFVALFSLRYEITFLKNNKVGTFNWVISILNFLTILILLVVLLSHHLFDQFFVITTILVLLLMLFATSSIQLITRRRMFRDMSRQLYSQREKMIRDMHDIIDEKKREKIREKYEFKERKTDPSTNGKSGKDY